MLTSTYHAQLPNMYDLAHRLAALKGVWDNQDIQKRLMPRLLLGESRDLTGPGVVLFISMAVDEFCQFRPFQMQIVLSLHLEELLTAMIADEKLLSDAKEFWSGALQDLKVHYRRIVEHQNDNLGPAIF